MQFLSMTYNYTNGVTVAYIEFGSSTTQASYASTGMLDPTDKIYIFREEFALAASTCSSTTGSLVITPSADPVHLQEIIQSDASDTNRGLKCWSSTNCKIVFLSYDFILA